MKGLIGRTGQVTVLLSFLSCVSFKSFGLETAPEFNRRFQHKSPLFKKMIKKNFQADGD